MKVLWLINVPLPEVSELMGVAPTPFGGWLINAANDLSKSDNIELLVTFPFDSAKNYSELQGKRIKYYPFSPINSNDKSEINNSQFFLTLLNKVWPDIVQIFGTESAHTLSMVNACNKLMIESVVSIQGLISVYSKHYYASLPYNVVYGFTIGDLYKKGNVHTGKKNFESDGKNEIEALEKTHHIIGRTTWDKACSLQVNPKAHYHHCNETLREEFYNHQWSLENCEKHSIFVSQGQYPIKGLHTVLEALPLILKKFPDTKVYVSGWNITSYSTWRNKLSITRYGKHLRSLIIKNNLENSIVFLGPLNEKKMCERFLHSHLFVCPSSIENSPNSLGEAMILGVPAVAAYVGGIPDMLIDKEEGYLYQHDAPYMLANFVCEVFTNDEIALRFSKKSRQHALRTHNRVANNERLIEIYGSIINK